MATAEKKSQTNDFKDSLKTYFKGVKNEWSKLTWPERRQIIVETGIVLSVVTFFTLVVYFMDIIFKAILGLIK